MPSPRGNKASFSRTAPAGPGFCCAVQPSPDKNVIGAPALQYPGQLPRNEVLRVCLALDDAALCWVCDQLLRIRTQVYEQVYVSNRKPEEALPAEETEAPPEPPAPQPSPPKALQQVAPVDENDGYVDEEPFEKCIPAVKDPQSLHRDAEVLRAKICNRDLELYGKPKPGQVPTIQFEAAMYFCLESDPTVEIGIIRIGDVSQCSSVQYRTKDLSAKAGVKYEAASGTVRFEKGERMKTIQVVTIDDSAWDATLEFTVELMQEGLEHGLLGRYLWVTRVKILDDDCFPSNRFSDQIEKLEIESLNKSVVMWDYFRMNIRNKVVRRGMIKTILSEQCENVYFILGLFANLYMVDYVLCEECDKSNAWRGLLYIVIMAIVPFPFLHWLEYREAYWKVGGATRMTLQSNLLRKYLAYDVQSLQSVDDSRLILAMTRDAQELAKDAFGKVSALVSASSRLTMLLLYQILVPVALGQAMPEWSRMMVRFGPSVMFPVAMAVFLWFRNKRTEKYLEITHGTQNDMIAHVRKVITNFDVFRDYRKRGMVVDQFEDKIRAYNKALADSNGITANNKRFATWCSLLVSTSYIAIGGPQVSNGSVPIGEFLNYLAIFTASGSMWGVVYEMLLSIQNSFDALETIVTYMNLPTENGQRMAQFAKNLQLCRAAKEQRLELNPAEDPSDSMHIELRQLEFQYKSTGVITCRLPKSNVVIPQGGLYAFVGPPSEGKGTILKLIGEVLIPAISGFDRSSGHGGGDLLVPAHIRALHVSKDPMFVEGTLMQNLKFGVANSVASAAAEDCAKERILGICRKLQISEAVLKTIEEDTLVCQWGQVLSSTEAALVHLARALTANPELLCIHKPALYLNNEMSDNMYKVLKEFVNQRGLFQDPAQFHSRRPRTCIVTARRAQGAGAAMADAVFHVSLNEGIQMMKIT